MHRNCIGQAAFMQNDFFIAQSTYSPRLLSFTFTDQRIHKSSVLFMAAERGWSMMYAAILVDNFKCCESNRRRDSSDLAAGGSQGTTSNDTASNYISSLIEVDGMVAGCISYPIRIGGSSVDRCELVAQLLYIAIPKLPVDCFHI